jgi:hypothetical protein
MGTRRWLVSVGGVLLAGLLAAVTVVMPSAGAAADVTPVVTTPTAGYIPWYSAPCATGAFGTLRPDPVNGGVVITANVVRCGAAGPKLAFAVVSFDTTFSWALASAINLHGYAADGDTTMIDIHVSQPDPQIGICLMKSVTERMACVRLDTVDGVSDLTAIAVDDPLVSREVRYDGSTLPEPTDPSCATCVWLVY